MSSFIDKLNRLSRGEHQPIGFGVKKSDLPGSKIQLVAGLTQESAASSAGSADAVLLRISKAGTAAESLQQVSKALPDIPRGGWLQSSSKAGIKQLLKAGCDFLVFPAAGTPLAMIEGEAGKILEIEPSLNEGLLRTINELPVDAVLVADEEKDDSLTWQQLMLFQRFAGLLMKPLLVSAPAKVTGGELLMLWEAGVSGVVVEAGGQDQIKKLRQEIDKLDFPSQRRREKPEALLPRTGRETSPVTTEEEEEDDEDY